VTLNVREKLASKSGATKNSPQKQTPSVTLPFLLSHFPFALEEEREGDTGRELSENFVPILLKFFV